MRPGHVMLASMLAIAAAAAVAFFWLSAPTHLEASELPAHEPNAQNGEHVFWASGCASCHAVPEGEDPTLLAGGLELETPYGVFRVPNITPDPEHGIGGWSMAEFVDAVMNGTSPDGRHYYPSFPYGSYHRMRVEDVMDLKAFLDTLQPSDNQVGGSELAFPYNVRRGVGLWKLRYLSDEPVVEGLPADPLVERGRYLVEAAGHCGECHTARDRAGGLRHEAWLAGGANPEGEGRIPNITPHEDGIGDWSESDIAYALESGFTPSFDTLGGSMAAVVRNLSHLTDEDRQAIAVYLKAIPPLPTEAAAE